MPGANLHLDGYIRVSKVGGREGESFHSPDEQRDRIQAWANLRGVTISEWHVDLDQSGDTLARPGLTALMDRIRSGATSGVAVAYLDRLSRADVGDALRLVEEIHDAGGELAAVDLGIDPTTPFGEFAMTLMLALARMQRRRISDGWAAATERAVTRGVHAQVPFGYRKSAGKGSVLEPDPNVAAIIPVLFERRIAGESWSALARWLGELTPPTRGGLWTRRAVETIIRNPAYRGEARYGRHVNPAAHEALVDAVTWDAAQAVRGLRPARGEPWLLSGLVRCAGCRHRLQPATVGQTKAKVYRCKRRHNAGECPAPAFVARGALEQHVEALFLERYGNVGLEGKIANDALDAAQRRVADTEAELAAYRDNTQIRALLESVGGDTFMAGLEARARAVVAAGEALSEARRDAGAIELGPALDLWPELTVPERRRLLGEGIDTVFLRRVAVAGGIGLAERVRVLWRGEAPNDLPGPGVRLPALRGFDW